MEGGGRGDRSCPSSEMAAHQGCRRGRAGCLTPESGQQAGDQEARPGNRAVKTCCADARQVWASSGVGARGVFWTAGRWRPPAPGALLQPEPPPWGTAARPQLSPGKMVRRSRWQPSDPLPARRPSGMCPLAEDGETGETVALGLRGPHSHRPCTPHTCVLGARCGLGVNWEKCLISFLLGGGLCDLRHPTGGPWKHRYPEESGPG